MSFKNKIRESVVAGSFYPDNSHILKEQITGYLNKANPENISDIKTIVCPHAGYIYSGQVAAYSYKQISGMDFDTVAIIAPSHSDYFDFVSVYDGSAYETPLGLVEVDEKNRDLLCSSDPQIRLSSYGHRSEHSLEVQIPFLQLTLKNFKIIPIVIGNQSTENIFSLGNSLGDLLRDRNILIVASTDLSHYHPYNEAVSLDSRVVELIENFSMEEFLEEFTSGKLEMCGGGPVAAAMIASQKMGANASKILKYNNSGDVSGDRDAVVGYLSAVFYKK